MIYAYIRVSTDKQDVESQKIGVTKKAAELGVAIDEWICDDGVSGVKEYADRQLGVLMDKIRDGDTIIVPEISRLARSVFMLFRIVEHCTAKVDAVIHAVKEGQTLKRNDVVSAIILAAYGTAAQIEREMICKRTREGLERRRQAGVVLGRPVGSKTRMVSEKHAEIMKQVTELNEKRISMAAIAKIVGISRSTLNYMMKKYSVEGKTWYKMGHRGNKNNLLYTTKYGQVGLHANKVMNSERTRITEMICNGMTQKGIHEEINKKYPEISYSSVYRYLKDDATLWGLMTEKNREIRAVKNADCGKYRSKYTF